MLNRKTVLTFLLIFTSIIFNAQCAMCKAVVESGNISMAEGVNSGITYLMVFPYLLIGVLFYVIYRYKKKAKI
jgi:cobalamin biosynthesis protein CobD/CbiB